MIAIVYPLSVAMFFVIVGATKVLRSKSALVAANGGAWAGDFSASAIKGIGALEVIAALALAAASLIDEPGIALIACSVLGIVMIGAAITHVRRAEYKQSVFAAAVALAVVAAIVLILPRAGY